MEDNIAVEPKPIRRLNETLINKIAAGEIIHRPASALKELLENSLDASATSIRVTVKEGGMKLLQIQDNGCGIRKTDLPILAERFTTSKLSTFSDLSRITTYGFRGEALASMSHVAHLSVVTKTKADSCAWKATYSDGALVDPKTGQKCDPRPCAGNDGTMITIDDLFYNTPTRLSALRSTSEEYSRILDVVTKYAIHNPSVSFVCKKAGAPTPDLSTPSASDTPTAIRLLYGHSIAKELLHHKLSSAGKKRQEDDMNEDEDDDENDNDNAESWIAETYFTNANYQAKKMVFLLFINHRLVESSRMKRAFESAYQSILPKGSSPFVYLSLQINPRSVDVNVHPTKREVHFLNEEAITEKIADGIQETLAKQSHSRTFEYQTLLTGGIMGDEKTLSKKRSRQERDLSEDEQEPEEPGEPSSSTADPKRKVYSQHKVRTCLQDRTLDSMFPVVNQTQTQADASSSKLSETPPTTTLGKLREVKESRCFLTSVKNLRQSILKGKHRQLTEILEKHTFIGIVDIHRCLSLIQSSTKLYLVNHDALAEELFYQLGLRQFGDFSRIKLEPSPSLREMIEIAVETEDIESTRLTKVEIVARVEKILMERREMLAEYFSLSISEAGFVESIPLLLRDYVPNLDNLPGFLMRLGPQIDWTSEAECFETFLRELAYFYTPTPPFPEPGVDEKDQYKAERWQIQHILFPAMRRHLVAPKSLLDRDVVQIANLPDLYKVFERC
ncbi:hypothetical protein GALMADRAFT_252658 [Galerina marginata CBS 339.88]|uniref:DNA mismatch repair protein S5 domain-containing protein n=1 Tax=Galerina marginata (strain CBS 339.88) TaxID=685588 RepID=A0A067SR86_GALM3|nr:hypothetical protein GALMADRAFT_252658 [Galerina marginata CBS 339.88]